jgi:RNA polymerase sigma-70 factor (ECF subfamily)
MPEILTQTPSPALAGQGAEDRELVAALRRRDEEAFVALVERYGPMMRRVAQHYVRTPAVAEEVVQETWCAVLTGIDRFEGRARLKTWLFRILVNRAMRRGQREARCVPFSSLAGADEAQEGAVPAERFLGAGDPRWPGHWASPPQAWPEERLLARETVGLVREAIARLPIRQRDVVVLRDVEGWDPTEVCDALGLSEGNQRVLLHRGRSRVREALERHLDREPAPA